MPTEQELAQLKYMQYPSAPNPPRTYGAAPPAPNSSIPPPPPAPPVMQFSTAIKNAKTGNPIKFKSLAGTDNTHTLRENISRGAAHVLHPSNVKYGSAAPVRYYTSAGSVPRRRSYRRRSTKRKSKRRSSKKRKSTKRKSTKRKSTKRKSKRRSTKRKSTSKKRNSVARDFKRLCKKYNLKV
jgi:hypothetical protein